VAQADRGDRQLLRPAGGGTGELVRDGAAPVALHISTGGSSGHPGQDPSLGPRSGLGPVSGAVPRAPIPDGSRRGPYGFQTIVGVAK
jgi:hypothetical protein